MTHKDRSEQNEQCSEVTHSCPLVGRATTSCCGKSPFELPQTDRLTIDPELVTCNG